MHRSLVCAAVGDEDGLAERTAGCWLRLEAGKQLWTCSEGVQVLVTHACFTLQTWTA
jgi:hypothetical protein